MLEKNEAKDHNQKSNGNIFGILEKAGKRGNKEDRECSRPIRSRGEGGPGASGELKSIHNKRKEIAGERDLGHTTVGFISHCKMWNFIPG